MKKISLIILVVVILVIGFLLINKSKPTKKTSTFSYPKFEFIGNKGENVVLADGEVKIDASTFNDNQARFYNVQMQDGKTIYFFALKDRQGIYRAAANACQVCFATGKGFHQEGDEIVCNNCGNRYPIEKIATEKGGCNPGPINPNLEVRGGNIIVKQADIEQVVNLF
jgi:uncharacterized membrane protein